MDKIFLFRNQACENHQYVNSKPNPGFSTGTLHSLDFSNLFNSSMALMLGWLVFKHVNQLVKFLYSLLLNRIHPLVQSSLKLSVTALSTGSL